LESHIGAPLILQKDVESRPTYVSNNDAVYPTLVQQANEQLMAFIYLENSDRKQYGSVLNSLNSQKSLGNDQYSKTLIESNNVLGSHPFDENHKNTGQSQKDKDNSPKEQIKKMILYLLYLLHRWKGSVTAVVSLAINRQHVATRASQRTNGPSIKLK
jgi:hypothetical protein